MPVSQPLPDGPFTPGTGTPGQDVSDLVAFLTQKGTATDTEVKGRANHTGAQALSTVTGLQAALDAKLTGTTLFPLGCAENPVTDPAAVRPTDIPSVWWRTETNPTNAIAGDVVDIVAAPAPAALYEQTFGTDIGSFTAKSNASNLLRDTARYSGGALRWTATAAGTTQVESPLVSGLAVSTGYTVTFLLSHSNAAAKDAVISLDEFTSAGGYLRTIAGAVVSVPAGAGAVSVAFSFTTGTTGAQVKVRPEVRSLAAGEFAYADNAKVAAT